MSIAAGHLAQLVRLTGGYLKFPACEDASEAPPGTVKDTAKAHSIRRPSKADRRVTSADSAMSVTAISKAAPRPVRDEPHLLGREVVVDRQLLTVMGAKAPSGAAQDASERFGPSRSRRSSWTSQTVHSAANPANPEGFVFTVSGGADQQTEIRAHVAADHRGHGSPKGTGFPCAEALLRLASHPPRRERQDGAGSARPRQRCGDARQVLAPVAGLGRPDP